MMKGGALSSESLNVFPLYGVFIQEFAMKMLGRQHTFPSSTVAHHMQTTTPLCKAIAAKVGTLCGVAFITGPCVYRVLKRAQPDLTCAHTAATSAFLNEIPSFVYTLQDSWFIIVTSWFSSPDICSRSLEARLLRLLEHLVLHVLHKPEHKPSMEVAHLGQ